LDWIQYILIVGAGLLAGVINTLAGSGSLVTLPLLVFLGLSPNEANGTNRVGIVMQSIVAVRTFRKRSNFNYRSAYWIVLANLIGALIGARVAVDVPEFYMNLAIAILMAFMFCLLILKPGDWLRKRSENALHDIANRFSAGRFILFMLIGFYGGFIQAGVGIFLLAALVLSLGHDLIYANAVKLLIVLVYSLPVLAVFLWAGQVVWSYGLILASGQMIGAWLAARFASENPQAQIWIRRLLLLVVLASLIKISWDLIGAGRSI
jgi:uncharacterized membrane protein YfcA